MNPLWNTLLVGGVRKGERFLGYVDLIGTTYTASTLATGYGAYMCVPLPIAHLLLRFLDG